MNRDSETSKNWQILIRQASAPCNRQIGMESTITPYWTSDFNDAFDEEIPDDLETSDRYLAIPHKNELDLGRSLVLHFVAHELPACYDQVEGFFQRQGAYARFKDLLARKGVLERWYAFEADAVEGALSRWCAENGIEIVET
ncbi:hypothetical protein SAMN05446935_8509 [Burkholderia sp. YR290]|nr:hypothetical protein SAMN05446935_8509 [Burkholderia sp. YR290]